MKQGGSMPASFGEQERALRAMRGGHATGAERRPAGCGPGRLRRRELAERERALRVSGGGAA